MIPIRPVLILDCDIQTLWYMPLAFHLHAQGTLWCPQKGSRTSFPGVQGQVKNLLRKDQEMVCCSVHQTGCKLVDAIFELSQQNESG